MAEEVKKDKFNEEEFLKKVEKAASKGAGKAGFRNNFLSMLPTFLLVALLAYLIIPKVNALHDGLSNLFVVDAPVEDHDMTIENHGIFGHTVVDFQEAILGDSQRLKKLEVYRQELSDAGTITNTGLFNLGMFTKNQVITYNGFVVYTVDLSMLSKSDIVYNEEEKTITLKIPHAKQEEINIPEDRIQFSDPEKGLLAFGDIKATPEQISDIQAGVRQKMQEKLDADNVLATADRFAKLSVWEMYTPIIKGVAKDYSLEVEFR